MPDIYATMMTGGPELGRKYRLIGELEFPDPVSSSQRDGVTDLKRTFDAAIPQLESLQDLAVTAVELMPVAQFPDTRNWGYDDVYRFAFQIGNGRGPGLKRFEQNSRIEAAKAER